MSGQNYVTSFSHARNGSVTAEGASFRLHVNSVGPASVHLTELAPGQKTVTVQVKMIGPPGHRAFVAVGADKNFCFVGDEWAAMTLDTEEGGVLSVGLLTNAAVGEELEFTVEHDGTYVERADFSDVVDKATDFLRAVEEERQKAIENRIRLMGE